MSTQETITPQIEAIIAQYGVANEQGDVLTHKAAMALFDQLRAQESTPANDVGYYLVSVRMEGNKKSGQIVGTFEFL